MSLIAATARLRPASGPALGKAPLPVTATLLSTVLHVAAALALVVAARYWVEHQPKTYIVNLVPAVAAVGSPQGKAATLPPKTEVPVRPSPPPDLPQRETARETPRAAAPEMPPRSSAPALPDKTLPDRALPARAPATPRAGEKELPQMASTAPRTPPATGRETARDAPPVAAAPPPAPLGRRDGSPQGSGAMTLNATDFPFAWYLSRVQAKVTERWAGKALPGAQPVIVFDIGRDGQVSKIAVEKTSGNTYYDQAALRAITEATPFPPLPGEFQAPSLRVHLGFNFNAERG